MAVSVPWPSWLWTDYTERDMAAMEEAGRRWAMEREKQVLSILLGAL